VIGLSTNQGFACRAYRRVALIAAIALAGAGCGGGNNNTSPTPVSTSSIATTSTTTTTAPATTTTSTATTSTATTSIPGLSVSFRVEGNPSNAPICSAASNGSVDCRFIATATGGTPGYTFNWRFVGPLGGTATPSGQQVDPVLGCDLSAGARTFNVEVTVTVTDSARATATVTRQQAIVRREGSCGV
jgi:hypothetical protein